METITPLSRAHVERIIAGGRVALAACSLFAVWMDPAEPGRFAPLTYSLHTIYLIYSLALALLMWRRHNVGNWPVATQIADIGVASVFQYLTLGPSSPFFVYFAFALFSAALRWGSRGTLRTAAVVLIAFTVTAAFLSRPLGPAEFELSRFMIRVGYLLVLTVFLVYLGQHEERLREEVRRLARWPLPAANDLERSLADVLKHSAGIVGASRALLIWERDDEPWTYSVLWPGESAVRKHRPRELDPSVPADLEGATFVVPGRLGQRSDVIVSRSGVLGAWTGRAVTEAVALRLGERNVASAPLRGEGVVGRVFFGGVSNAGSDLIPLAEVVARELGASVGHLYAFHRSREIAISEDRIRLARDLHDGVMQSLTGVRLELQSLAEQDEHIPARFRERLRDLERALAGEQRELRSFINDLRPMEGAPILGSLSERLQDLRRRIELQWRVEVSVRVSLDDTALPAVMQRAVPLMVHEAVVNAIRHARPSKVGVDIRAGDGVLAIAVEDDGDGFPFKGRKDHLALVSSNVGPISLRERVASLGGRVEIDSRQTGSRVELLIPLEATQ